MSDMLNEVNIEENSFSQPIEDLSIKGFEDSNEQYQSEQQNYGIVCAHKHSHTTQPKVRIVVFQDPLHPSSTYDLDKQQENTIQNGQQNYKQVTNGQNRIRKQDPKRNQLTITLKKFIRYLNVRLNLNIRQYPGIHFLLQEKEKMLRKKRMTKKGQVSFNKTHLSLLVQCQESARVFKDFLQNHLASSIQESNQIYDSSIYLPCVDKYLKLFKDIPAR